MRAHDTARHLGVRKQPAPAARGARPGGLLALQRTAGNRAVARSLDSSRGGLPVQRARPDVQDRLTERYWAQQAVGKNPATPGKRGSNRSLTDILTKVGPQLLDDLRSMYESAGNQASKAGQLKLYRRMTTEEASAILAFYNDDMLARTRKWVDSHRDDDPGEVASSWHKEKKNGVIGAMPVSNHLGDKAQADRYDDGKNRMLEFTLKPGAHEFLFHPEYMAVAGRTGTPDHLRAIRGQDAYREASQGEGILGGYIGLKNEKHGDFSISLGDSDATRLLFQLLISSVREVT
ncbi:hypothetical protein SUDANB145_02710 [Streptomyces sp. enrichment culture]|uniref:hypothetical protein n=1 Tax=Streptomyces sp. enrichment culture TaxID=1795815 RepID=UPI003F55C47C